MQLTFLGTGAGAPSATRNVTSIGLQFDQRSAFWLFDCGESTQNQMLRSALRFSQLERIFITHMHGDHIFGLPGLLATRSLHQAAVTPVTVYGPPGLSDYWQAILKYTGMRLSYPVNFETIAPGLVYEDEYLVVTCAALEHRILDYGYAVQEKPQPGHFDPEAAAQLGIPAGPLYGRLKKGEVVSLPDGRQINGAELIGPERPGRKLVYCSDTVYSPAAVALAQQATVLIHEATYSQTDLELAVRGGHSTAVQAALVAQAAGVETLILTHFSARYDAKEGLQVEDLLKEAQAIFPNSLAASDFWSYKVNLSS